MVKKKNFNKKLTDTNTSKKSRIKANAPVPIGRFSAKCKHCNTILKATTNLHQTADEDDPTLFCPKCGWNESM